MAENLGHEAEDLLQSALSDAFSAADIPRVSTQPPAPPAQEQEAAAAPPPASASASDNTAEDAWKAELDAHLVEWRVQSAEQRAKAEAERTKWEAVREQEEKEGKEWESRVLGDRRDTLKLAPSAVGLAALGESSGSVSGWESVAAESRGGRLSPGPANQVGGEAQGRTHAGAAGQSNAHSRPMSESSKQDKWEDIPSDMASSYPSLDYPSDPHSPSSSHPHLRHGHEHEHAHGRHEHDHHRHEVQKTATAAIFDSTLSTKTRVLALASTLAINLMLPFINGVMLGFGEIFAKNIVVGWLGWRVPGSTAANIGVRARARGPEVRPKSSS